MFGFFKKKSLTPSSEPDLSSNGLDYSEVDSLAKARKLARRGELEKLFLMPLEFGGKDNDSNVVYVPVGLAEVKRGIDTNIVAPLLMEGKVSEYKTELEYQAKSAIPTAIKITASNPGSFSTAIRIWGEASARE